MLLADVDDEQDAADVLEKVGDETIATDANELREYLQKVGHPALTMQDMAELAEADEDFLRMYRRLDGELRPLLPNLRLL